MKSKLTELVRDVLGHVVMQREFGADSYEPAPRLSGNRAAARVSPATPAEQPLSGLRPVAEMTASSPREIDAPSLEALAEIASKCTRCRLAETRHQVVFGAGSPTADLVFVGEAPGRNEDLSGVPFVGAAGELLDRIILAMGLSRDNVYICNIIKCRPPGNRNPLADEIQECEPFLLRQLDHIRPKVICALGTYAAQTLLHTTSSISKLRGRFHRYHEIELMPTYHPAYLLRNPWAKRLVWEDMQKVQASLGMTPGSYVDRKAPRGRSG